MTEQELREVPGPPVHFDADSATESSRPRLWPEVFAAARRKNSDIVQMTELIGRAVEIHSLVSRPALNGRGGKVISYDAGKQRYGVRVDGEAAAMLLKPSCLLYGPVFEDDPELVVQFNAEHLVGHALRGQVKCVERILDKGVDVNACCHMGFMGAGIEGHPALDVACEFWLLPHNDPGTRTGGSSLLPGRVLGGDAVAMEAVVRLLLQRGAHADTCFPPGSDVGRMQQVNGTALMRAARGNHQQLVKLLLQHGAQVPSLAIQDGLRPGEEPAASKLAREIASGAVSAEIAEMLRRQAEAAKMRASESESVR